MERLPDDFKRKPFKIGHKQHPVCRFIPSLLAKPLFSHQGLWYMGTRGDKLVVTYNPEERKLEYYQVSMDGFRDKVMANSLPFVKKTSIVPKTVEWIGTIINRDLSEMITY